MLPGKNCSTLLERLSPDTGNLAAARLCRDYSRGHFSYDNLEHRRLLAGVPTLIDIFPGNAGSFPGQFVNVQNTVFFVANGGETGFELWKSDGTPQGTVLVKDIQSGPEGSQPRYLTNVNGTLFFSAEDGLGGRELWKSLGTADSTVLVKDIRPNQGENASSSPLSLTNVNGTLFFVANDGQHGNELWRSDGTETGTSQVLDIFPGQSESLPFDLINVNGTLFFGANDGSSGNELWSSNGTAQGTKLVADIRRFGDGLQDGQNSTLTNVNGTLMFLAADPISGFELWKSDGTTTGTRLVKDILPGSRGSVLPGDTELVNVNGTLFFAADNETNGRELWKSDGTEAGTVLVKDIHTDGGTFFGSYPQSLCNVNGVLFFRADDGPKGFELWRSDGTTLGTVLIKNIRGSETDGSDSNPELLTNVNGVLYFLAVNETNGKELWKSDGTKQATELVVDLNPGSKNSEIDELISVNGNLLFNGDNGTNGSELWILDAGGESSVRLREVKAPGVSDAGVRKIGVPGAGTSGLGVSGLGVKPATPPSVVGLIDVVGGAGASNPQNFTQVGNSVFFTAELTINSASTGRELWVTDGTVGGTLLVQDIFPGSTSSNPTYLTNVNGILYFSAFDSTAGRELFKSDGTSNGTALVSDINLGESSSSPKNLTNVNGRLFFTGDGNLLIGRELFVSDGTQAGTSLVKNIHPGERSSSSPNALTNVRGQLFFTADDGNNGRELWKSDGTGAGTQMIKDIFPGPGSSDPWCLANSKGVLFFSANDGTTGFELWKSTGVLANTVLVKDINPGPLGSNPMNITNLKGNVLFTAAEPSTGRELWRSNGNGAATGTLLVKDIRPGAISSEPSQLLNLNGVMLFSANDGSSGLELFRSNSQPDGTVLVKNINPGSASSNPANFYNLGSILFFSADNGVNGTELWQSNIFSAGTKLVADINPGQISSNPSFLSSNFNTLVFAATDSTHGTELWTLSNPQSQGVPPSRMAPLSASDNSNGPLLNTTPQSSLRGNPFSQAIPGGLAIGDLRNLQISNRSTPMTPSKSAANYLSTGMAVLSQRKMSKPPTDFDPTDPVTPQSALQPSSRDRDVAYAGIDWSDPKFSV